MRCPECQYNQKYRDGMVCRICGYRFVFDPKTPPQMNDYRFTKLIEKASHNHTYYFTFDQLYACYCRKKWAPIPFGCVIAALVALGVLGIWSLGIALSEGMNSVWLFLIGCLAAGVVIWGYRQKSLFYFPPSKSELRELINTWKQRGNKIEYLIEKPSLYRSPPVWPERDIYDYGVEAILIVERDILVDLLVRNGWHAQQKTLVISQTGYPEYLKQRATELIAQNPKLPVYILHDYSPAGRTMASKLQRTNQFSLKNHHIIDIGIHKEHVDKVSAFAPFRSKKQFERVPVDVLANPTLMALTSLAVAHGISLTTILNQPQQWEAHTIISFG